ncbi:MAG: putative toxin-antitoxin system toxin component, PIN family [Blastocatellia bacterium]
MGKRQVVIDTNVLIAALMSQYGASYKLLTLLGSNKFEINLSVPLVLEYEDVAKRLLGRIALTTNEVDDVIDYVCLVAHRRKIHYLWRPFLNDPKDEMVLELAVAAGCDTIVTYNKRDFRGVE